MKTVQIVLLLALASVPAWGSSAKVDSLKRLLEHHATADKAEVLWNIAYELFDVDNGQAVFYAERAYHEVWKRGDSLQIVKVGTTYGQLLRRVGKVDHSIEVSSRILPIAKRHGYRKYWKMLLNSLGLAHIERSVYDVALDLSYQSLILRQEDGDTMELATAFQNIGLIYYRVKDMEKSLEFTQRSIELIKSMTRETEWRSDYMSTAYGNIACVHFEQRQFQKALRYFGLSKIRRDNRVFFRETYLWTVASSFLELDILDSAMYYAREAIDRSRENHNLYALAQSYIVMSKLMLVKGDIRRSQSLLDSAVYINKVTNYPILGYAILRQNLNLLALNNAGQKTVEALSEYDRYGDSLNVLKGEARLKAVHVTFAQRENESKLSAQSAIMLLQQKDLDRQQTFVAVVSVLLVLLLTLSIALYRSNGRKQAINQMLDRIVEDRTRELSMHRDALQHLVDEENSRRTRITAELGSLLGSLKGILHLAHVDPEKHHEEYLEKAIGLTLQIEGISNKYVEQAHQGRQAFTSHWAPK